MAHRLFTDQYFEQLLAEMAMPPLLQQQQQQHSIADYSTSRTVVHRPSESQSAASSDSMEESYSAMSGQRLFRTKRLHRTSEFLHQTGQKRHQRPAHKKAEMRRLFKIREGISLLTDACGIKRDGHASEATQLKECRDKILETQQQVSAQRDEIDQLKRSLSASGMPAGQAIDYVQTKWLEEPKFAMFYKLAGKIVTDAFLNHLQHPGESFPEQWMSRIRQEEISRKTVKYFKKK